MREIWLLGATGRCGRAAAARLAACGFALVLVGRDPMRLRELADAIGGTSRIVTAVSVDAIAGELARGKPGVVVNTVGPFAATALPLARACPPGTHYIDLSNELSPIIELLALHDEAAASGRTIVTGAGFGLLATESVVLKLCAGQPVAARVRVSAMPSVEIEPGRVGEALAGSIIDGFAKGGRRYADGHLVRTRFFNDFENLRLPDGTVIATAAVPTGDMEAARRASGAAFAVSASSMVPTQPLLRAILPSVLPLMRFGPLRNLIKRRVATIEMKPRARTREFSWTHARVSWASGESREGWLRLGDAMEFTTAVLVEVASRLARDEGRPGAYTPGALFGPELAIQAGGTFVDRAPTLTDANNLPIGGSSPRGRPLECQWSASLAFGFGLGVLSRHSWSTSNAPARPWQSRGPKAQQARSCLLV